MDVEHVIFSAGQEEALEAYERTLRLGSTAAHIVFFGDHVSATVFTTDTPRRLNVSHKAVIERAVAEAGRNKFIGELEPIYAARVNRRLSKYFMAIAQMNSRVARVSDYVPALITG